MLMALHEASIPPSNYHPLFSLSPCLHSSCHPILPTASWFPDGSGVPSPSVSSFVSMLCCPLDLITTKKTPPPSSFLSTLSRKRHVAATNNLHAVTQLSLPLRFAQKPVPLALSLLRFQTIANHQPPRVTLSIPRVCRICHP